jgi:hypothetical protein
MALAAFRSPLLSRHFCSRTVAAARTPNGVSPKRRQHTRLKMGDIAEAGCKGEIDDPRMLTARVAQYCKRALKPAFHKALGERPPRLLEQLLAHYDSLQGEHPAATRSIQGVHYIQHSGMSPTGRQQRHSERGARHVAAVVPLWPLVTGTTTTTAEPSLTPCAQSANSLRA